MIEYADDHEILAERSALRAAFIRAASDYSEQRWCAQWMSGIEVELREIGGAWLVLAMLCGGWPTGEVDGEWLPVTDDEAHRAASTIHDLLPLGYYVDF